MSSPQLDYRGILFTETSTALARLHGLENSEVFTKLSHHRSPHNIITRNTEGMCMKFVRIKLLTDNLEFL